MSAPRRVVSLVPSLTELVFSLGRGDTLVGRTRFCTEPAGALDHVAIIGGTKNPSVAKILAAGPDLVLANKEENRQEDIVALQSAGVNVLLTDPNDVAGALKMISGLGTVLEAVDQAEKLIADIERALADSANARREPVPVFVPIWYNPLMALGQETYGNDLLAACGGINVLDQARYPGTSLDEVSRLSPALVLLPNEPFPFDSQHVPVFERIAPTRLVDGKLLWWYGPRMPAAIRELSALIHEASADNPAGGHVR